MLEKISLLSETQIEEFSAFIRSVYDEFVAVDYSAEGNKTFYDFIDPSEIRNRFGQGNLFLIAESANVIIGGLELRNLNHISLLFVDKAFHKQGVGRSLFAATLDHVKKMAPDIGKIEVNSSPYAKDIYTRLGFHKVSELKEMNGIKYYEMIYEQASF